MGIVESIMSWMKFKAQEKMNKKCGSTKHSKLKGEYGLGVKVPKYRDTQCFVLSNSQKAKTL